MSYRSKYRKIIGLNNEKCRNIYVTKHINMVTFRWNSKASTCNWSKHLFCSIIIIISGKLFYLAQNQSNIISLTTLLIWNEIVWFLLPSTHFPVASYLHFQNDHNFNQSIGHSGKRDSNKKIVISLNCFPSFSNVALISFTPHISTLDAQPYYHNYCILLTNWHSLR